MEARIKPTQDAIGQALLDFFHSGRGFEIVERDDGDFHLGIICSNIFGSGTAILWSGTRTCPFILERKPAPGGIDLFRSERSEPDQPSSEFYDLSDMVVEHAEPIYRAPFHFDSHEGSASVHGGISRPREVAARLSRGSWNPRGDNA